jgi:ABC-type uncharacterized transport system permease subunit
LNRERAIRRLTLVRSILGGILAALVLAAILLAVSGVNPFSAYRTMLSGSFGSGRALGETLLRFAPIAVIGAGLTPALRAGLFNVGAPGQLSIGAFVATVTSIYLDTLPRPLLLLVAAVAGAAGGFVWGLIPALLRAYRGVNEILSTLVFNFIGASVLFWLLNEPFRGGLSNSPQSEALPANALLPILLPRTRLHAGVLIAVGFLIALALFQRTTVGYRVRLYGANRVLARHAGINEPALIVSTMSAAAAAAGVAGWMQVAGVDQRLYATVAALIGFNGLFVAVLGNMVGAGILTAALFFGALAGGGQALQFGAGVPIDLIIAMQGLVLLMVGFAAGGLRVRAVH